MMKKNKIKKVVLINPHLRNLRRNLRIIFFLKYEELFKWYFNQKLALINRRGEFEQNWDPIMRKIRENFLKSTLGCHYPGGCLTYQKLINKKKSCNIPRLKQKFHIIAPSLYEYLTIEELMDVDLVKVNIDGLDRWICTECYRKRFKPLQGITRLCRVTNS